MLSRGCCPSATCKVSEVCVWLRVSKQRESPRGVSFRSLELSLPAFENAPEAFVFPEHAQTLHGAFSKGVTVAFRSVDCQPVNCLAFNRVACGAYICMSCGQARCTLVLNSKAMRLLYSELDPRNIEHCLSSVCPPCRFRRLLPLSCWCPCSVCAP